MKLINIKLLMEDELLYSYIIRLADANVFSLREFANIYIFPNDVEKARNPHLLTGNMIYIPKIADLLEQDPLDLYLKTTTYPAIAPLLTPGRQVKFINMAFRKNIWKYPHMLERASYAGSFRYCPICLEEDIREYNFTWLRRTHNLPGVTACHKHKARLIETKDAENLLTGRVPLPENELLFPNETEISYARFTKDFLYSRFDTDRNMLIQSIFGALSKTKGMDIHGKTDMNYIRESIRKSKHEIGINNLFRWLFEIFHEASNIPVNRNDELHKRFMGSLRAYKLISDYYAPAITMRRMGEIEPFVTTSYAFLEGWRSPIEDYNDEQKKFVSIVMNIRDNEYIPFDRFTGMGKTMRFRHRLCGKIVKMRPVDLIENGLNCSCMQNYVENNAYLENPDAYTVLSVDKDGNERTATIKMHNCGHVFTVPVRDWFVSTRCRVCGREKYISRREAFKRNVEALVGNEYEVIGEYVNRVTPVEIKHLKCGKITSFTPDQFLRGKRCKCEVGSFPIGADFLKYVQEKSDGLYEIIGKDIKSHYFIKNTKSGKEKCMGKQLIIQELTRPTPSTVLP
ncbi:MAG: TniQ family protein [Anaerolineaceae bacterium]|nr:TniQ family protein [Anaerolineaceae bacterium]